MKVWRKYSLNIHLKRSKKGKEGIENGDQNCIGRQPELRKNNIV